MEIKLDAEAAASIAAAAIFDSLSQETRESVIKDAVKYLLTPTTNRGYGQNKTPLQEAFEGALFRAAREAVEKYVQTDPEVNAYIQELLGPLIRGALNTEATDYKSGLANKIGEAIGMWLNEQARNS